MLINQPKVLHQLFPASVQKLWKPAMCNNFHPDMAC